MKRIKRAEKENQVQQILRNIVYIHESLLQDFNRVSVALYSCIFVILPTIVHMSNYWTEGPIQAIDFVFVD